jgi:SAM-dependent methyltransferase
MLFLMEKTTYLFFMQKFWEQKFADEQYKYGKEPNDFFRQTLDSLLPGKILLPGEGEGRNAVYAARRGWNVDAVDFTNNGKDKALRLAKEQNVNINYYVEDITDCTPKKEHYDAVSLIFLHLPQEATKKLYQKLTRSLKPGGMFFFQLYSKEQINFQTGGPKSPEMLYNIDELKNYLKDMKTIVLNKHERLIHEGDMHFGKASVIDYVGKKPAE